MWLVVSNNFTQDHRCIVSVHYGTVKFLIAIGSRRSRLWKQCFEPFCLARVTQKVNGWKFQPVETIIIRVSNPVPISSTRGSTHLPWPVDHQQFDPTAGPSWIYQAPPSDFPTCSMDHPSWSERFMMVKRVKRQDSTAKLQPCALDDA